MLRTVTIKVNAAHPEMPLPPSSVFTGSAASLTIIDVPRAVGSRSISAVWVTVTNVASATQAFQAVRVGSAWEVTIPATAIGASGKVGNGLIIAASGTNESGATVPQWILGAGDLEVMNTDGTVSPGVVRHNVAWYDTVPASPAKGYMAVVDGVLKIYNGTAWQALGGGGSGDVKHSDFAAVDPDTVSVYELARILKGEANA